MDEPIPTTEEMREAHRWLARDPSREDLWPQDDAYSDWDFDRWLAEHDREIAARAWDEGNRAPEQRTNLNGDYLGKWPNPYRETDA